MAGGFTWLVVLWCLVMAVLSTWQYARQRRAMATLRRLWQASAPPVPPVRVLLRTGETLTVQPEDVQQTWTWWVRLPDPSLVDEVELPELPPWTSVVPVPADWPRP